MGRKYIDADRLIRRLENRTYKAKSKFIDMINEQEAADVVEVVRCAECKYWDRSVLEHQANDFREWDEAECGMLAERDPYHEIDHYTEEDDFCSRGERKNG